MLEIIARDPQASFSTKAGPASRLTLSAEMAICREAEQDESVIDRITAAQREIVGLQAEAERVAEEARELAGEVPF